LAAKTFEYEIEDDSHYLFTCAQLKAREFEFIDRTKFERMAAANTIDSLNKIISETCYANFLNLISRENNLDSIILEFNRETVNFLMDRLKEGHRAAIDLLMHEEIIHNYKVILKSLILKKNLSSLYIPLFYSYENLVNSVNNQYLMDIDRNTRSILDEINSIKDIDLSFQDREIKLEKFYVELLYTEIEKVKSKMLLEFIGHFIDILNIKNTVRVKHINARLNFNDFLIDRGFLPVELLKKYESESIENLVQELKNTDYYIIIEHGLRNLLNRNSFFSFDKNEYVFYLNFLDNVKYTVANLEKIFSFFMRKKIELKIMNMIYLGVLYGIEKSKLSHKAGIIGES